MAEKAEIKGFYPAVIRPKAAAIGLVMQDMTRRAYAAGVRNAFGTDSGVSYHGDNACEFAMMHAAGIPVAETIVMATRVPAEMLGVTENLGTVQAGRHADLVAVDPAALKDLVLLMDVAFVMKGGEVYVAEGKARGR